MNHISRTSAFSSITLAFSILLTVPALAADKFATKDEFVAAAAGKTLTTKTKKGDTYTATYDAKGGGTFAIGSKAPAKFTWTFKGDTLCSEFKSMKFTECNKVVVTSPAELKFVDAKSGSVNNVYSVK